MRVVILSGSPKNRFGASHLIGTALARAIEAQAAMAGAKETVEAQLVYSSGLKADGLADSLSGSQALVVVFPLYVDGLPSKLIEILEGANGKLERDLAVYGVINCGYFDSAHNELALEMLKNFCRHNGLRWGQALSLGGGAMLPMAPNIGRFPFKALQGELEILAKSVIGKASAPDRVSAPTMPRLFYKVGANLSWYMLAHKNKVKFRDLRKMEDLASPK